MKKSKIENKHASKEKTFLKAYLKNTAYISVKKNSCEALTQLLATFNNFSFHTQYVT